MAKRAIATASDMGRKQRSRLLYMVLGCCCTFERTRHERDAQAIGINIAGASRRWGGTADCRSTMLTTECVRAADLTATTNPRIEAVLTKKGRQPKFCIASEINCSNQDSVVEPMRIHVIDHQVEAHDGSTWSDQLLINY